MTLSRITRQEQLGAAVAAVLSLQGIVAKPARPARIAAQLDHLVQTSGLQRVRMVPLDLTPQSLHLAIDRVLEKQ